MLKQLTTHTKFTTSFILLVALLIGGFTYFHSARSVSATPPTQTLMPLQWMESELNNTNPMQLYTFEAPSEWMLIAISVSPNDAPPYAVLETEGENGKTSTIGTVLGSGFFCIKPNSPQYTLTMSYNPDSNAQAYGVGLIDVPEELTYLCASLLIDPNSNIFDQNPTDINPNTQIGTNA